MDIFVVVLLYFCFTFFIIFTVHHCLRHWLGLLCTSLRSSWWPSSAICQMSSTFSSASSPQHFWDPCVFCRPTASLEFTAWSSARSSYWLRTI